MIKAQILIEMKDGSLYTYANHFLEEKDADVDFNDNYTFKGEPGKYYMYTGEKGDTYETQDEPGQIKADYEYLLRDVEVGTGYLTFPEDKNAELPVSSNGNVDEIEISRDKEVGNSKAFSRTKLKRDFVKCIKVVETEVAYPFGRPNPSYIAKAPKTEELYTIPKEIKTTYERYVPLVVVDSDDGFISNFEDFDFVYYRKPKMEQWIEAEETDIINFDCELVGEIDGIKGGITFFKV